LVMCHQISVLGIQTAADLRSTIEVEMARLAIRLHVAVRIPRRQCLVRRPENADHDFSSDDSEATSRRSLVPKLSLSRLLSSDV